MYYWNRANRWIPFIKSSKYLLPVIILTYFFLFFQHRGIPILELSFNISPTERNLYNKWFFLHILNLNNLHTQNIGVSDECDHINAQDWEPFLVNADRVGELRNEPLFRHPKNPKFSATGHLNNDYQLLFREMLLKEGFSVGHGGTSKALNFAKQCYSKEMLAVLVPYRNRTENLVRFIGYIHRFLSLQRRQYRVILLEQANDRLFNRGKLLNAGLKELGLNDSVPQYLKIDPLSSLRQETHDCVAYHDIDKLPYHKDILYSCGVRPVQLARGVLSAVKVSKKDDVMMYYTEFLGGVTLFNRWSLIFINGASNSFQGWGGEDDDIYYRLLISGFTVNHIAEKTGIFLSQSHHDDKLENKIRNKMLEMNFVIKRMFTDGFAQARYKLVNFIEYPLYTLFKMDV